MSKIEYKDILAFHPGYYIKDIMNNQCITQDEMAKRLGINSKMMSELINGKISLPQKVALNLSTLLGTSVDVWLNLQKTYDEKCLEIELEKKLEAEQAYVKDINYDYFISLGVVPKVSSLREKAKYLLQYLNVSSFKVFLESDLLINFRTAVKSVNEKNILNSNIWVQTALNIGSQIETMPYDEKKLKSYINEIRGMTVQDPKVFYPRLYEIFKSCGIAFVLLPHLKNSGVNGAVKWIDKQKVILAINNRRKYADSFWFSLFHELGHVMQYKLKQLIINCDLCSDTISDANKLLETQADKYAQDILINPDSYKKFLTKGIYTESSIKEYAKSINIHPGIVVGRMQRDCILDYKIFHSLKAQYEIT